jgi:hypothetical protein
MNLPQYKVQADPTFHRYQFTSIGPKGSIVKVIQFLKIEDDPLVYNLGLGDIDPITGVVDDEVVSGNNDIDKILATIGYVVVDFCNRQPGAIILAEGNTSVKRRLYQMRVSSHLSEIQKSFYVYGLIDNEKPIEVFAKNRAYKAILVKPILIRKFDN